MNEKNEKLGQPPASDRASQQASQPQTIALNGQEQNSDRRVNEKQREKREEKKGELWIRRGCNSNSALSGFRFDKGQR